MRPERVFDTRLQHERTSLSWERTAFSGMVVGFLIARRGASVHLALAAVGLLVVLASAGLLVWSGKHYEDLHGPLRAGESPTHTTAAMVVGFGATLATALATGVVLAAIVADG